MGKGFGRGAKSVGIVTHAQVKGAKKMPKGLRGSRKKRRQQFERSNNDQTQLEESMGIRKEREAQNGKRKQQKTEEEGGTMRKKSMAQEVAGVQFQHVVNKRQKGFKQLRKHLMSSVKEVRKRYAEKNRAKSLKNEAMLAARYAREAKKALKDKESGNMRRVNDNNNNTAAAVDESSGDDEEFLGVEDTE